MIDPKPVNQPDPDEVSALPEVHGQAGNRASADGKLKDEEEAATLGDFA